MNYRRLGKTGLMVSEIGFGGEWLERHPEQESIDLIHYAGEQGINILDCWMPDHKSRDIIGKAIRDRREKWFIQGHVGSTLKDGQYYKTRDMAYVVPAFEDLLTRLRTDYIDLGMIHFVDSEEEWDRIQTSDYLRYVLDLKAKGVIRHIGMSSHNPKVAIKAANTPYIEMILFSVNPAFDMVPSTEDILDRVLVDHYDGEMRGIVPERMAFYQACEQNDVGITVMKGFAGGRLFDASRSPFGVALTPVQCIHYALTRPAAASILCGYDTKAQVDEAVSYETATEEQKDYAAVIGGASVQTLAKKCMYCNHCKPCPMDIDIAMVNKYYDLAVMQPEVPASLKAHYHELAHNADDCIGCGGCETRCPFQVNVVERMAKARELFA